MNELIAQLVDFRRTANSQRALWQKRVNGDLRLLSPQIAYPRDAFDALKKYERAFLLALAAGRNMYTSVLVGRSAGRINGMWVVATTAEKVEFSTLSGNKSPSCARNPAYVQRYFRLASHEVVDNQGARVTSHVRTFVDIARIHGFVEGLVALDWLLHEGYTLAEVSMKVEEMGRIKGIAVVRHCLSFGVSNSDSALESYARALMISAGVVNLVTQFRCGPYFVDLCIDGWFAIEIDGRGKYQNQADAAFFREKHRQNQIESRGFTFRRVDGHALLSRPSEFVSMVLNVLHRGNPLAPPSDKSG